MHINIFTSKIIGHWITQTTKYKLLNSNTSEISTFINQIKWTNLSDNNFYADIIKKNVKVEYIGYSLFIYKLNFSDYQSHNQIYYIAFSENHFKKMYLLKFNENFTVTNWFIIKKCTANYLCLTSENRNNTITITQKIYFLNANVKLIKSVIKNKNKYIATTFSSEIKIS